MLPSLLRAVRCAGAVLLATVAAARASAEAVEWRPAANPDPLRAASLPFDPAAAASPPAGRFQVSLELAYFNLWSRGWRTSAIHRELGRVGRRLSSEELRLAEERYAGDSFQHVDLEGWRSDLRVAYGLGRDVAVSVHVPWIELGRPHWDQVGERWHKAFSLPTDDRPLFPRGGSLFYLHSPDATVERRDLDGSGVGDVGIALSLPGGRWAGATHRLVLAVEAPTGDDSGIHGSGGVDAGVRWFSSWRWTRFAARTGAGWTRLDPSGSLLGLRRADPWHLMAGAEWSPHPAWSFSLTALLERSLLAEVSGGHPAEPAQFLRLGVSGRLSDTLLVTFDVGQDSHEQGIAPDYSFHLAVLWGR